MAELYESPQGSYLPAARLAALASGDTLTGLDDPSTLGITVPVGARWLKAQPAAAGTAFARFTPGAVKPIGATDPGVRNVGHYAAALTPFLGDYILQNGEVVTGLDIFGQVTAAAGATNAYVYNCRIRGKDAPTSQNAMAVGRSFNFQGTLFEFCTFDGTSRESPWMDCINGGGYTMRYCDLGRGVDGIGANTVGNATIEACRIRDGHYSAWWNDATNAVRSTTFTDFAGKTRTAPFPSQSSGDTHSDGCQIQGWSGWVLRGNYFGGARAVASNANIDPTVQADYVIEQSLDQDHGYANAALIVNALSGAGGGSTHPVGALVELNWFDGGAARVNISTSDVDLLTGLVIQNNRFVRSAAGYYIYAFANHQATLINNVFDDTGAAVPIVLH
jgi:hypothetical protein